MWGKADWFCFVYADAGAAVVAAVRLAKQRRNKGKLICTVLPSLGERYLSTALFNHVSTQQN